MSTIQDPKLSIDADRERDNAKINVTCGVEFTEFEVNAMNLLGMRYSLHCELLDMDMLYEPDEVHFLGQEFPRTGHAATMHEQATFESQAAMHVLHRFVLGKDTLVAELTLRNEETGESNVMRSKPLRVDLS